MDERSGKTQQQKFIITKRKTQFDQSNVSGVWPKIHAIGFHQLHRRMHTEVSKYKITDI